MKKIFLILPLALIMGCITGGAVVNSGDRVSIEYQASVLNHTFDKGSISFVVSEHSVIPGLESGVIGMKVGEEKNFTVPPQLAYGEYDDELLVMIGRDVFNESEPKLYDKVTFFGKTGMIVNVSDELVIVDLNHWLAGHELLFYVKVLTIEKI
jgi:FKBP-type peptidyl-prolyl cis-trans isomerase 2